MEVMTRYQQDAGNAKPCITTTLLEGLDKAANKGEYEDMVINVSAMAFQGAPISYLYVNVAY